MEYDGTTVDVVARGIIGARRGTSATGSGSGAGAGFGAVFFFFGFFDAMAAPPAPPAQQRQQRPMRSSHIHVRKADPEEPEPVEPELRLEPDESPEEPHLKELEYEDFNDCDVPLDDAEESHGVKVVVLVTCAWAARAKFAIMKHTLNAIPATGRIASELTQSATACVL